MDLTFLAPLMFLFFVIIIIMSMLSMIGLNPMALVYLFIATRRHRTEIEPRDHYDRWDHAHRRSSFENKPRTLRYLMTKGDRMVPNKSIGRIVGCEPWLNFFLVYIKTRRWSWSAPHFIPQDMCSDLNRRVLWVRARGFSNLGTIRIPIPVEGETFMKKVNTLPNGVVVKRKCPRRVNDIVDEVLEGFRFSMEQQLYMDITEDMHWGVGSGMAPPIKEQVRITEADAPGFVEKDYVPEDQATGGRIA